VGGPGVGQVGGAAEGLGGVYPLHPYRLGEGGRGGGGLFLGQDLGGDPGHLGQGPGQAAKGEGEAARGHLDPQGPEEAPLRA